MGAQGARASEPHLGMTEQEREILFMEAVACSLAEEDLDGQLMSRLLEVTADDGRGAGGVLALGGGQAAQQLRGMDPLIFSQLPVSEWATTGSKDECPLCLCEYEAGEHVLRMPCFHSAHEECAAKWLERSTQCPCCKFDIQEAVVASFADP